MNQTEDAGEPVDGETLVALMAQLAAPVAEPDAGPPLVALSVAGATAQQTAARTSSTSATVEVPTPSADQAGVVTAPPEGSSDGSPVLPPPPAADTAPAELASDVAPKVEETQLLPLASVADEDAVAAELPETVDAPIAEEPAVADLDATAADAVADDAAVERPAPEPVRVEAPTAASREPATPANVVADDAALPPVGQATSTSARSTTPVSATEPAAVPPSNEAFTAELASTVRRASLLGDQEVRLLLNPPELGHLDVRVVESPEGLRIVLEAASAEARELIEQQLPALRTALEGRDLKVERLQVDQALDASALDEQAERDLRQDGQGEGGPDQSGQDATPWSPTASLRSDDGSEPAAAGAVSGSESNTQTAAGDGRLDVLA